MAVPQTPNSATTAEPGCSFKTRSSCAARGLSVPFITSAIYPAALTSSFSTVSPVSLQVVQAMSTHVANTTHVDGGSGPAAAAAVAVLAVHTVAQ